MSNSENFVIENGVLIEYNGDGGDVVIPDGVTNISEGAFDNCKAVTSLNFIGDVQRIGNNVFENCLNLEQITFGGNVGIIGANAFKGCTSLSCVVVSGGIAIIKDSAFEGCISLARIDIPDGINSIGKRAFENCTGLVCVDISENTGKYSSYGISQKYVPELGMMKTGVIDSYAFKGCKNLHLVNISNRNMIIKAYAFCKCSISHFVLPFFISGISDRAFSGCKNIENFFVCGSKEGSSSYEVFITKTECKTWEYLTNIRFYAEEEPAKKGEFWHYVDGVPTLW